MPAFLQAKFVLSEGNDAAEIEDAILKTDPIILQRVKPATQDQKPFDRRKEVAQVVRQKFSYSTHGSVRFVFRVQNPQIPSSVPRVFVDEGNSVTSDSFGKVIPSTLVIYCDNVALKKIFPASDIEKIVDNAVAKR